MHVCTVDTPDSLPDEAQGAYSESGGRLFEVNTDERVPAVEDTCVEYAILVVVDLYRQIRTGV